MLEEYYPNQSDLSLKNSIQNQPDSWQTQCQSARLTDGASTSSDPLQAPSPPELDFQEVPFFLQRHFWRAFLHMSTTERSWHVILIIRKIRFSPKDIV